MNVQQHDSVERVSADNATRKMVVEHDRVPYRKPQLFQLGSLDKVQYGNPSNYCDYQGGWKFSL